MPCPSAADARSVGAVQEEDDGVAPARAPLTTSQPTPVSAAPLSEGSGEVTPALVKRASLLDRLLDAGEQVIAVTAPAGYGKTTLLADWAERRGARVGWVSC